MSRRATLTFQQQQEDVLRALRDEGMLNTRSDRLGDIVREIVTEWIADQLMDPAVNERVKERMDDADRSRMAEQGPRPVLTVIQGGGDA